MNEKGKAQNSFTTLFYRQTTTEKNQLILVISKHIRASMYAFLCVKMRDGWRTLIQSCAATEPNKK